MASSDNQTTDNPVDDFTTTWRYKVGFAMIVGGNLGILISMLLPLVGVGAGTVGALVLGCELISLGSIVFLGKQGFKAIKSKFFTFVKTSYTGPVSPTRHYIGISFLCINLVTHYIVALYLWDAFDASTATTAPPVVWGLDFDQQESMVSWLFLIAEVTFLSSIYILGGDWWDKFRNIVVWKAPEG